VPKAGKTVEVLDSLLLKSYEPGSMMGPGAFALPKVGTPGLWRESGGRVTQPFARGPSTLPPSCPAQ
jgi:hypothetical protein